MSETQSIGDAQRSAAAGVVMIYVLASTAWVGVATYQAVEAPTPKHWAVVAVLACCFIITIVAEAVEAIRKANAILAQAAEDVRQAK